MSEAEASVNKRRSERRRTGIVLSYVYTVAQVVVNLLYVPILLRGMEIASTVYTRLSDR